MKTNIAITNRETISFVTRVNQVAAGQGLNPRVVMTRPRSYSEGGRLRGSLLVRFVAHNNLNHRSGL
jgi:hypothetical protein